LRGLRGLQKYAPSSVMRDDARSTAAARETEGRTLAATSQGWLIRAPGAGDRVEGCFSGLAYAPHRHDTYAVGITLKGVQSFDYRGSRRDSLPGQLVILHPDEVHDGRSGDEGAFRYRTAYVAPAEIQAALGGRALPFIEGGVIGDPRLRRPISSLLRDFDRPLTTFEYQDALLDLASALAAISGSPVPARIANRDAAIRARDYIEAGLDRRFSLAELERATSHDRWQLSRDFRALFGTSPYRYLIMRRLDKARLMLLGGHSHAQAAHDSGFSDQSHFTRLFKRAYGLTPNAWFRAVQPTHDRSRPA
jgi:AraC-like DNA-binding protein